MSIRFESPQDINYLRQMIQSGQVPEDAIDTMAQTGAYVAAQPQAQQRQRMKVLGVGGGQVTDLGEEDARALPLDYTRAGIDIPGVGKGTYSRDGRYAVVQGPDGPTKVILGYDAAGSRQATRENLAMEKARADIAHTQEAIAASQYARNQRGTLEAVPGAGISQVTLEKQFGKAPEGKRWSRGGQLEDVPGYDGSGKLTESQGKAAGMATRAIAAHEILTGLENSGTTTPSQIKQAAESIPIVGGLAGTAVNAMGIPSVNQNRVEQAQRDFVNAVLRPESGASISASEFDNARRQYFPQPGDTPEIIQQKQQAREREIGALGVMSGTQGSATIRKMVQTNQAAAPVAPSGPPVGTIKDGYVFMGGPAGSPSSWRKVR